MHRFNAGVALLLLLASCAGENRTHRHEVFMRVSEVYRDALTSRGNCLIARIKGGYGPACEAAVDDADKALDVIRGFKDEAEAKGWSTAVEYLQCRYDKLKVGRELSRLDQIHAERDARGEKLRAADKELDCDDLEKNIRGYSDAEQQTILSTVERQQKLNQSTEKYVEQLQGAADRAEDLDRHLAQQEQHLQSIRTVEQAVAAAASARLETEQRILNLVKQQSTDFRGMAAQQNELDRRRAQLIDDENLRKLKELQDALDANNTRIEAHKTETARAEKARTDAAAAEQ